MKHLKIHTVFICLFLVSCTSNTILEKPDDLIPPDKMTDILTDMFIANGAELATNKQGNRNVNYFYAITSKYGIDSTRFNRSNYYYTSQIDAYDIILKEVQLRLNHKRDSISKISKHKDSLRNVKTKIQTSLQISKSEIKAYNTILKQVNKLKDSVFKLKDSFANRLSLFSLDKERMTVNKPYLKLAIFTDTVDLLKKEVEIKNRVEVLNLFMNKMNDYDAIQEVEKQIKTLNDSTKYISKRLKRDSIAYFPINQSNNKVSDREIIQKKYSKSKSYLEVLSHLQTNGERKKRMSESFVKKQDSVLKKHPVLKEKIPESEEELLIPR